MSQCDRESVVPVHHEEHKGVQVAASSYDTCSDMFVLAIPCNGESDEKVFEKAAATVRALGASVVSADVFGISGKKAPHLVESLQSSTIPTTWVEEGCDNPEPLRGLHLYAVTGTTVDPVVVDDRPVGSTYDIDGIRYCRLGGLLTRDPSASRGDQTKEILELMSAALTTLGMDFYNVIRTWFYNYRMLDWYDDFNAVRTAFFRKYKVFDGIVPASTCIGGHNIAGAALTAGLLAAKAPQCETISTMVNSPLQCPAPQYGSSFSRAVELSTERIRRLFVSGTASIAPDGKSTHIGDIDAQIALTFDVVSAILESRDMTWDDTTRAIAYFKKREDAPRLKAYLASRGMGELPFLITNNDICRDDLLFEIEMDATAPI
ncbi:MAG: hypothetical protein K1Y02_20055 [Candidatus Hydrogenedentes bacterium]|nr:hypothetical protein [Candidatus Hydrogenedentota bacterium]